MMAGPCRQTKDGPECSGPSLARRPVESRAELLRLSEVDGDGLAVVRPLSLVNFQIVRFRIVVEPGRDREFRLSVAGIVFAGQPRQRRVRTDIQRRQRIGGAVQLRQRRVFADIQRLQRIVGAGQPRQRHIRTDIQRRQLIAVAVQLRQRRVRAYIQRRQLIVFAGQLRQRRVRAHIQRRQLIGAAGQPRQRRIRAEIQRRQLIEGTGQLRQRRAAADIQRRQRIVVAPQRRQRRVRAYIQRRQLIVIAGQLRQRLEILDSLQGGQGFGILAQIVQLDHIGQIFHILSRDLSRIVDMAHLLQSAGERRGEPVGEIRDVGHVLGDGHRRGLLAAGDFEADYAFRLAEIPSGRQFDGLAAGRAACGRDGQPIRVFAGDGERPVGRSGEGEGCRAVVQGIERVLGLFDDESGIRGARIGIGG